MRRGEGRGSCFKEKWTELGNKTSKATTNTSEISLQAGVKGRRNGGEMDRGQRGR